MLYLYTLQLEKLEKKGYKLYMNQIKPMLLTTLKSYDRSQFVKDVTAGIIALPLSIALALTSGVGPQAGIFTAIVAGFVISAFGGSSVQIAGPTALQPLLPESLQKTAQAVFRANNMSTLYYKAQNSC